MSGRPGALRGVSSRCTLVYAVSDGKVAYDFFLRNQKEFFERNLPIFEKAIATLRISAGPGH